MEFDRQAAIFGVVVLAPFALLLPVWACAQWVSNVACPAGAPAGIVGCVPPNQLNSINQNSAFQGSILNDFCTNGTCNYIPLEPLPTDPFSRLGYGAGGGSLSDYLSAAYILLITIGALSAIVMLTVGGLRYMFSEAFTDLDKAKKQIWSALWGLLIIVGSFLILHSINPELLKFNLTISSSSSTVQLVQPTVTPPSQRPLTDQALKERQVVDNQIAGTDAQRQQLCASTPSLTDLQAQLTAIELQQFNYVQSHKVDVGTAQYKDQLQAYVVQGATMRDKIATCY